MKATPAICDFCTKGRLVVKLPALYSLLICSACIDSLRRQVDYLKDGTED